MTQPNMFAARFFERLPDDVAANLSAEQKAAIARAVKNADPLVRSYPIDLRFSVPFLFGRYFVAIVAGRERRGMARRSNDNNSKASLSIPSVVLGCALLASPFLFVALGYFIGQQ